MAEPEEHLGYYTGSRWISFSVAALVIAIVSLWLAASLRETEERTEKLLVELAVRRMQMGLQLAVGNAMMHGRDAEVAGWVGSNPTRWLNGELPGSTGDCVWNEELAAGHWCFDAVKGELHYRPREKQGLRLKNGGEVSLLKWRVVAENTTPGAAMAGLRVENLTPYEWFTE